MTVKWGRITDATAIEQAFTAVKRGGRFMIFGVSPLNTRISLSPFRVYNEEITIVGSMAVQNPFQGALDLLESGAIDVEKMLSTPYTLDEFPHALDRVQRGEGLKTQIILRP